MKHYFRWITALAFLSLGISACGGSNLGKEPNRDELGHMAQFLHQTDDGMWVLIPTPSKTTPPGSGNGNTGEEGDKSTTGNPDETVPPVPSGHLLINGTIVDPQYQDGTFLVEARDIRSCEKGLCADFDSIPWASTVVQQPGYFSLVVPEQRQAMFLAVTFQSAADSKVVEKYLGIVDKRVDNLAINF